MFEESFERLKKQAYIPQQYPAPRKDSRKQTQTPRPRVIVPAHKRRIVEPVRQTTPASPASQELDHSRFYIYFVD